MISTLNSLILDGFKPLTLFQLAYNFANIVSFEMEACGRLIYSNQMGNRRCFPNAIAPVKCSFLKDKMNF